MSKRSNEGNQLRALKKVKKDNSSATPLETPSLTLYIKNLNSKININTLKRLLYLLFSTYGDVIDIVLNLKISSMRGQAHIIFGKLQSSVNAMRSLQNFNVFEKPLVIEYSKNVSNIVLATRDNEEEEGNGQLALAPVKEAT